MTDSLFDTVLIAKGTAEPMDRVVNGKRTNRVPHRAPKIGERVVIQLAGEPEQGATVIEIGYVLLKTAAGETIIAAQQWEQFPKRAATSEDEKLFQVQEAGT